MKVSFCTLKTPAQCQYTVFVNGDNVDSIGKIKMCGVDKSNPFIQHNREIIIDCEMRESKEIEFSLKTSGTK